MIEPRRSPSNRTRRVPYASVAAALKFPGRCRVPNGEYKDRRDVDNGCDCRSYIEILTAGRWRALGFYVRAGEHANFRGGKQKTIPLFCACQVVNKLTPTDYLADLAPCAACDEPAELDSNGLCSDCASVMPPDPEPASENPTDIESIPGFASMPTMLEAPSYESEPASAPATAESARPYEVPIYHLSLVRDSAVATERTDVSTPESAATILNAFLAGAAEERIVTLMLDTKNHPIGIATISTGGLASCNVDVGQVFKPALLANAKAIILCHNHPSGDTSPSAEDVALTRKIVDAGKLLDVEVLDHVIVDTLGDFTSLRVRGLGFSNA